VIGRAVISKPTPRPPPWRDQIVEPMQQVSSTWLYRWKNHGE